MSVGLDLERRLRQVLSPERFLHTRRVARSAALLAGEFGLDRDRAWLAGLAHDWAREWPGHELLHFMEHHGYALSHEERHRPVLLHGRVAAHLLFQDYGIRDEAIVESLGHHTLGQAGMGALARIVFVADYAEPGRKYASPGFRQQLRAACLACRVRLVIEHSASRHGDLHSMTKELYDEVRGQCAGPECAQWGRDE